MKRMALLSRTQQSAISLVKTTIRRPVNIQWMMVNSLNQFCKERWRNSLTFLIGCVCINTKSSSFLSPDRFARLCLAREAGLSGSVYNA